MMKKLLLTTFLSAFAFFAATAQTTISSVTLNPTTIERGTGVTVEATITYTSDAAYAVNVIGHELNSSGEITWATGAQFEYETYTLPSTGGVEDTYVVDVPVGPSAKLTSQVTTSGNYMGVAVRPDGDGNGVASAELTITGTEINVDFVSVEASNDDIPQLSTTGVDVTYSADTELEYQIFLVKVTPPGSPVYEITPENETSTTYATGTLPVSASETTVTLDLGIADDFVPSADLPDGTTYAILVQYASLELYDEVTIVEPGVSATLSDLVNPATATQGGSLDMAVDYVADGGSFSIDFGVVVYNTNTNQIDYEFGKTNPTAKEFFSPANTGNADAATATEVTGSFLVPSNQMSSSDLAAINSDLEYKAIARIYEDGQSSTIIDEILGDITINEAAAGTIYEIEITSISSSTLEVGETVTVNFSYDTPNSATTDPLIKVSFDIYEDEFTAVEPSVAEDVDVYTNGISQTGSVVLTIPYGSTLSSSDLKSANTSEYNYKITVGIFDDENSNSGIDASEARKSFDTEDLTVSYVTGLADIDESGMTVHPNPATNVLYVNAEGTVIISDMTGAVVKTVDASNSIDVSDLDEGVYILTTETGQTNKFVKK